MTISGKTDGRRRVEELLRSVPSGPAPHLHACALQSPKSCCGGKGYVIGTRGAYTHADICSCLKECPVCYGRGTKFEGNDSVPCRIPEPRQVVNALNDALIPARYAHADLSQFSNFSGNGQQVVEKLAGWVQSFKAVGSRGIVLGGPVGVGKTYLLAAIAKDLAIRGFSVRFTDFFQLLADIRAGFEDNKSDASHLAPLIDVDVLVIDELGKGRNREYDRTIIDQLVCGRYNQNKTIVASTNYLLTQHMGQHSYNIDLERLNPGQQNEFESDRFGSLEDRVGKRIHSRLREIANFVDLTGDDYRGPRK
jgi:DNA replication protein DnaC